jgi:hypothetical protein
MALQKNPALMQEGAQLFKNMQSDDADISGKAFQDVESYFNKVQNYLEQQGLSAPNSISADKDNVLIQNRGDDLFSDNPIKDSGDINLQNINAVADHQAQFSPPDQPQQDIAPAPSAAPAGPKL